MKKQLLISAIFVLAVLLSVTNSYAQSCDDALKPMAGKKYTYGITVNPTGGTFDWFVTSDLKLATATAITNGTGAAGDIIVAGTGYNLPTSTTASIDITWTAKAVAEATKAIPVKYYLVVKYTTGCTNNIKPWRITPINLFQITVVNVNSAGDTYAAICRSPFVDAVIGADDKVTYDFGENAFYLKVTANNFTGSWTPKVDITALQGSLTTPQTIKSIEWSLTTTFKGTSNFDLATGIATEVVIDKGTDNVTTGTDEFIYIKVVVKDASFEGTVIQTLKLNLSAKDVAGNDDVDFDFASCKPGTENDFVEQVLNARPGMTLPTAGPFLIAN